MPSTIRFLFAFLILNGPLFIEGATAADVNGDYSIRGAGAVSCEVYLRAREDQSHLYHVIAGWIDGYLTARNKFDSNTYDTTSFESMELITALLADICVRRPQPNLFTVIDSLTSMFAQNKLEGPSNKIEIKRGERSVQLYEKVIRRIQQKLTDGGFYAGPLNAKYDSATENAMKAYQDSIDFNPTGFPDQLTLWRMFNDTD